MTSLQTSIKQVGAATAFYIPLADIRNEIFAYRSDLGRVSTNAWSSAPANTSGAGRFSTLVASAGASLLKDMGKTIVSSNYTFRKIQLVVPNAAANSTFGVAGDAATPSDYLTGYISIGVEGGGAPTKVAKYGL